MIKTIVFFTKLMVSLIAVLLLTSCEYKINFGKGNGDVINGKRNIVEEFTGVSVSNGLDLVVVQSDSKSVVVEADDNLNKHISTKVIDGVLVITSDFNSYSSNSTKKITVNLPNFTSLTAKRGSDMKSIGIIKGDDVTVKAESGSDIQLAIESDNINVKSTSGSDIAIEGKALSMNVAASGGSDIDASSLLANDVKVTASGGSDIEVHAILNLKAKATGGSAIDYKVQPKHMEKFEGSGSSVSFK